MLKNDVVILAGGFGSRLRSVLGEEIPKPMVRLNGKPLLEWQIMLCQEYGFTNILILVHHLAERIIDYFGTGERFGVNIEYSFEKSPRGTAGAISDSVDKLSNKVLVIYGDTFLDVNLQKFYLAKESNHAVLTFCHPNSHPYDSDLVQLSDTDQVLKVFRPEVDGIELYKNCVNAALYVCDKRIFSDFVPPTGVMDISSELFPILIKHNLYLKAYISPEYIKDIGTPRRLELTEKAIQKYVPTLLSDRSLRRCIFLDRDGVINKEVGHLSDIASFELLPGVCEAIRKINESGYLAICVTNQPVIARGDLTETGLENIHMKMEVELGKLGAYLDAVIYCPHHPDAGFKGEIPHLKTKCECRKPKPGMLLKAIETFKIDPLNSWMIGDHSRDIKAGSEANVKTVFIGPKNTFNDSISSYTASNLLSAVSLILN